MKVHQIVIEADSANVNAPPTNKPGSGLRATPGSGIGGGGGTPPLKNPPPPLKNPPALPNVSKAVGNAADDINLKNALTKMKDAVTGSGGFAKKSLKLTAQVGLGSTLGRLVMAAINLNQLATDIPAWYKLVEDKGFGSREAQAAKREISYDLTDLIVDGIGVALGGAIGPIAIAAISGGPVGWIAGLGAAGVGGAIGVFGISKVAKMTGLYKYIRESIWFNFMTYDQLETLAKAKLNAFELVAYTHVLSNGWLAPVPNPLGLVKKIGSAVNQVVKVDEADNAGLPMSSEELKKKALAAIKSDPTLLASYKVGYKKVQDAKAATKNAQ